MEHETAAVKQPLLLPLLVINPTDIGRLIRELEALDEMLLQLQLRQGGEQLRLPKTSFLLNDMAELNKLNLLNPEDRRELQRFLRLVKQRAPLLHMSFSADPSPAFLEKLMRWLRQEIHPSVLVSIGLQPNIGAGCIVRTTNRVFDFSLRQNFAQKRGLLIDRLLALNQEAQT